MPELDIPPPELDPQTAERVVASGFWVKARRLAGKLPFVEDLAAAWFAARDPETPARVRAMILAALAYFVMPADLMPDVFAGLGFVDDAAVIAGVMAAIEPHMKPRHRARARRALSGEEPPPQS